MFVGYAGGAQEAVFQYSIACIAQPHYVAPTGVAAAIGSLPENVNFGIRLPLSDSS